MTSILYFLLWAGLFYIVMHFGCGAHVTGHGHHHGHLLPDGSNSPSDAIGRVRPPHRTS